ncbi:MAG TPA: hypothetical protein VI819_03135 [Patescibacteria group bacterium]|nr:hypothetical protein [Patescibacteria group bacterium]
MAIAPQPNNPPPTTTSPVTDPTYVNPEVVKNIDEKPLNVKPNKIFLLLVLIIFLIIVIAAAAIELRNKKSNPINKQSGQLFIPTAGP